MKIIISLLIGIFTFILCIWIASGIINWITRGFTEVNWRIAVRIILWVCFGGGIIGISIATAIIIRELINNMFK